MSHVHHTLDYVELPAPGLSETQDFYARAFGWEFTSYGPSYAGIRGATDDADEVGGLAAEGRSAPLVLLWSEDLDATLAAVREAGGEVVEGPYEFPGGRRFHFRDPAGSELGVWSSS